MRLNDDEMQDLEFMIKIDVDRIQRKFAILQTVIRKSLKERGVPTQEIVAHVIGLGVAKTDKQKLESEESLDRVFIVLTGYWSFLDYDLLDSIVEIYGNDTDRDRMEAYNEELKLFCNRRLSEVPERNLILSNDQTREQMVVKLNVSDPRLSVIRDLKIKACKVLNAKPCELQIKEVKEGCVQVTFLIAIKHLFVSSLTEAQCDDFKALSILSLSCAHFQGIFLVRTS